MFCANCGTEISNEASFCKVCGKKVYTSTSDIGEKQMLDQSVGTISGQMDKSDSKDSAKVYLGFIGAILVILFFLGFLDKPIAMIIQAIFG